MRNATSLKLLFALGTILTLQGLLVLIGYPELLQDLLLFIWYKAENDVFAEFVMKAFSVIGVLWFTRIAVIRAVYFADKNINYDEVRVQLMHFINDTFFIETLKGSGTKLEEVLHNDAYRKTVQKMLKSENEDSVLPLWRHKWGNSIVGAIAEFINSCNHDSNATPVGYYIVPCVIRTEQHTTCLTLNVMSRETMEKLQTLNKLHSTRVVAASHMDRFVVAHRAAQLFLYRSPDVYPSESEQEFRGYTGRCFRALRIDLDSHALLDSLQAEKSLRGEPTDMLIDWTSDEVISTLCSFSSDRESATRVATELKELQQAAA